MEPFGSLSLEPAGGNNDLSIRSWNYSQLHKRRTLQKEDIREAIQKTDIFDFLVDVI